MNEKLRKVLEFDEICRRLASFAVSEPTKRALATLEPSFSLVQARKNLALTYEAVLVKNKYLLSPIAQFDDLTEITEKARAGAVLRPADLLKVATLLRCGRIAKTEISPLGDDVSGLKEIVGPMMLDRTLEEKISDAVAGENEVRDDASEKLRALRRQIHGCNAKLKEKLASYTRGGSISKYLQDNIVTVRMGRFVLPVKSECRSMVAGLIHDQSSSGSTVYIEPFPVVELNNELRYLQMEETREIERILSVLSECVANDFELLHVMSERCTQLDAVFAKAAYAASYNGTVPVLNDTSVMHLRNARHPLIDPHKVVPVTVQVGRDYDILVITGPNTGGKTVCMKTVGLCCLMAYSGIPVPCDKETEIAVYDDIFCDLGDEQSIEQSLSTFSAHIVNLVRITDAVTPHSLVLLDELGAGTDPVEGAALSIGIMRFLERIGCKGIVTTHFNELKEYALLSKKLMNGSMQFDEQTLSPTYKLTIGLPGVSNALQIAANYGLNPCILDDARASISTEQVRFEEVLRQAQYAKMQVEAQKEELEAEKQALLADRIALEAARKKVEEKQEKLSANAKAEANRLVARMVEHANELLEELKETVKAGDEEALRKARLLRAQLENAEHDSEELLRPEYAAFQPQKARIGQKIVVRSLGAEGELLSLSDKKGQYAVRVGNVRMSVKADDLALPIRNEAPPKKVAPAYVPPAPQPQDGESAPIQAEIKLLGMTVSEAIEALEPFVQSAPPKSILRIVHGKGTGALGKGIQAWLKTRRDIAAFRYGRYGEGDTGVTLAEKK